MDKTEEKALDFMLSKSYIETIHRAITAYLLLSLSEIKSTLKIDQKYLDDEVAKYPEHLKFIALLAIKEKCFVALLNTPKTKSHLVMILNDTIKKKTDIIEEIIKQYGMSNDPDVLTIHHKMGNLFDKVQGKIRKAIGNGDFEVIYGKWRDN